ncbi:hypothetical protein [Actinomadura xylanilytica]|uniref:hypothetical protein n=1 Tax=Actinomadura xylanilytica TaxID=887459 RepID=UPI00255AC6DD|nr:hypothetical protein [Actinomadura xylanilytica]MDL4776980.1 hypothetical protein [Actinomadura xylanilytica]
MAVEFTRPGAPSAEDPVMVQAMAVWDAFTPGERRDLFRSLAQVVAVYGRTENVDHLVRFAESVDGMVRLESTTDLRQTIRETRDVPGEPAEVSFADMARRLEG